MKNEESNNKLANCETTARKVLRVFLLSKSYTYYPYTGAQHSRSLLPTTATTSASFQELTYFRWKQQVRAGARTDTKELWLTQAN